MGHRDFESTNMLKFDLKKNKNKSLNVPSCCCYSGQQGETANSFLATLASSSSEEMEAELLERVESSQKQANYVVEIYERLRNTVDQLKAEMDSGTGK